PHLRYFTSLSTPTRRPPRSPLFPYTTLFRSLRDQLTRAEALLAMCRKMDVDPTAAMNRFAEARTRLESDDFQEAMANIRSAMASDRKSSRLNSSHVAISYAVFCLKKKRRDA